ncbi:hypothetical protein JAAARDRAFT_57780 [Jaapia argillacea MUCL 33604]|uniref:Uncharacterized protein n=1 Tax=Jaapia argillacea MUCL 33604 TaxID=933084 RepID=A0A067PT23_9AGAM|nr:hypothetical protein JAAARDRAFT_57780 [Jaapia argillacea MUCL 33604]
MVLSIISCLALAIIVISLFPSGSSTPSEMPESTIGYELNPDVLEEESKTELVDEDVEKPKACCQSDNFLGYICPKCQVRLAVMWS